MLQFLQNGKALYVLAVVCGIGVISKLMTSGLYKRLIKETGNMALTKNKNLRLLKQKTENMFLLNHGIRNAGAYIEKQMYGFRFMKVSLDVWDNLSVQAMIMNFLLGGLAAFGAYWYRCDSYYIVLYGTMGILGGLLLVLVDNGTNITLKRQQLEDALVDYVENSPHFNKASGNRRNVAENRGVEVAVETNGTAVRPFEVTESRESVEKKDLTGEKKRDGKRLPLVSRKKERKEPVVEGARTQEELAKSIDSLKQSLDQIAASREQTRRELQVVKSPENEKLEKARKELSAEDLKFLGELLQEYLT